MREGSYPSAHDPSRRDGYREASRPALEAASELDDDPVSVRADGNGGGVPLSWDDE